MKKFTVTLVLATFVSLALINPSSTQDLKEGDSLPEISAPSTMKGAGPGSTAGTINLKSYPKNGSNLVLVFIVKNFTKG